MCSRTKRLQGHATEEGGRVGEGDGWLAQGSGGGGTHLAQQLRVTLQGEQHSLRGAYGGVLARRKHQHDRKLSGGRVAYFEPS